VTPPLITQARVRDAIARMLDDAAHSALTIESHVAMAIRSLFLTSSCVAVTRGDKDSPLTGAGCGSIPSPPFAIDGSEAAKLVKSFQSRAKPRDQESAIRGSILPRGRQWGMSFESEDGLELIVLAESDRPDAERRFDDFEAFTTGQREFFIAFSAVKRASRLAEAARKAADLARDLADKRREVTLLENDVVTPFAERLRRAAQMLDELRRPLTADTLALAERIAAWAIQETLGSGWGVRRLETNERIPALCIALRKIAAEASANDAEDFKRIAVELENIAGALHLGKDEPLLMRGFEASQQAADGRRDALPLLRDWARLHERARMVADSSGPVADDEVAWDAAAVSSLDATSKEVSSSYGHKDYDASHFRNWLRLWFGLSCIRKEYERVLPSQASGSLHGLPSPAARWRWRAHVAYVLREGLRFLAFADRPDFVFQPAALSAALRTIVERHATSIACVPSGYDVRRLLLEVAEVTRAQDYHFATEYLQHTLDVYIAGHFLCSIQLVDGRAEPKLNAWTIGEVLASPTGVKPGSEVTADFLRTFSLVALFHDVGMVLFPSPARNVRKLCGGDKTLEADLGRVGESLLQAGIELSQLCLETLKQGGDLDSNVANAYQQWTRAQGEGGEPDHGLLGAYYFKRVSEKLRKQMPGIKDVLRAIVLHGMPCHCIEVGNDPAAALLSLCDELFEWEPQMAAVPAPNAIGRSPHVMAVDIKPNLSRAARIKIHGVTCGYDDRTRSIQCMLAIDDGDWPVFDVELRHPEHLGVTVYSVWLSMGQKVARLGASPLGFSPRLNLTATVLSPELRTREVLFEVLRQTNLPISGELLEWLRDDRRFDSREEPMREVVYLRALNAPLSFKDMRASFPDLDREIERFTRERGLIP